jgi:hypothetical protein
MTGLMQDNRRNKIDCPECGASLVVIRIKTEPSTSDRAPCPSCASFLLPRDGDDLLQYKRAAAQPSPMVVAKASKL